MPSLVPNPIPDPSPNRGPLSDAQLTQLAEAKHAARRIRRTVATARVSAWTTGIFAGLTLLGVLFGDLASLVLGAALLVVAVREGRLASRLASFDVRAPKLLASNQLILGGVIFLYALWQMWTAWHSSGLSAGSQPIGDARVDAMLADVGSLTRTITLGFYLVVAVAGPAGTGLVALYYARRTRILQTFLEQTPPWIVQTMRAAA